MKGATKRCQNDACGRVMASCLFIKDRYKFEDGIRRNVRLCPDCSSDIARRVFEEDVIFTVKGRKVIQHKVEKADDVRIPFFLAAGEQVGEQMRKYREANKK